MAAACVLTRHSNVCQIGDCVQSIEGLASTSASPTDIWILNFKPGVTYYGQVLESAYLKIAISPLYVDTRSNQGVLYELRVYTEVVSELLDRRVCPHFVRCLLANPMCHFDDLLKVVTIGTEGLLPQGTSADYPAHVLIENIAFMKANRQVPSPSPSDIDEPDPNQSVAGEASPLPKSKKKASRRKATIVGGASADSGTGRPSITNFNTRPEPPAMVRDVDAVQAIEEQYRYVCIMNERSTDVVSLSDWLAKGSQFNYGDFLAVLFQLLVTLWVMELRKMVHYDLHTGNVQIEHTRPQRLAYVLNGVEYKINTTCFVRVFDFDQSYVANLGCNQWHTEDECQFIPNLDLARLLCDMFTDLKTSPHPRVTKFVRTLEEVFGVRKQNITPNVCYTVKATAVRKVVPNASGVPQDLLRDCLPRLAKRMEQVIGAADTFIIDERMFRPNGSLRSQEEFELMLEKKLRENPSQNKDWADMAENIHNLQTSVNQLKKEVQRGNADAAQSHQKTDSLVKQTGFLVGAASVVTPLALKLIPKR